MKGIIIYERSFPNTHGTEIGFKINEPLDPNYEEDVNCREIQRLSPEEINKERGNLSWTQFAIKKCKMFKS